MAHHRVLVGRLAADLIVARQIVGGLDHAADHAEALDWLAHDPAAGQAVVHRHRAGPRALAHVGGVVLGVAHALDAAGDHHIGHAGLHHHRRIDHGLQAGPAAAVELVAGDLDRQTGRQRRIACDAGRLAVGVALGEDHVVDLLRIDPCALDQRLEHHRAELTGGHIGQGAEIFPDGGADGRDDGGAFHGVPE